MANYFENNFPWFNNQNEIRPENPARHLEWVVDTGASGHCTYIPAFLYDKQRVPQTRVMCANGGISSTSLKGNVDTDGKGLVAKDVRYIPDIESNLLSVGSLTKDDHVVVFDKFGCKIYNTGDVRIEGNVKARGRLEEDGLYKLLTSDVQSDGGSYNINLWHRRLGHIDLTEILILQDYMTTGINMENNERRIECMTSNCFNYFEKRECPLYMTAFNYNNYPKSTRPLQLVYFYLSTSIYDISLSGNKYYIIFIDDYTRQSFIYFFRREFEIIPKIKMFKNFAERYSGNKIKQMLTDFDTNFENFYPSIETYLALNNINLVYSEELTAIIVWSKYIVSIKKLCFMTESHLPNEFWAEATNAAVRLLNISPSTGLPFVTPQQSWSGRKPDLSGIKVFGCKAYLQCLKKYVIHLGYDFDKGAYRFMDTSHYGIYYRCDAIFYEDIPFFKPVNPG